MLDRMAGVLEEWASDLRSGRPYLIWAILTAIVGVAGPFGTYPTMPLLKRLLSWAAVVAVVIVFATAVRAFVHSGLRLRSFRVGAILIAAILAVIIPPVAYLIIKSLPDAAGFTFPGKVELAIFVFAISLGVAAWRQCLNKPVSDPSRKPPGQAQPEQPAMPRLVERLPIEVQGPLVSISVRDHYIDVTTQRGQASLLLRLSDAVAETGEEHGLRVHRSHWVAWDAIEEVEHRGQRMILRLQGGAEVPVSKTYRPSIEERGLAPHRPVSAQNLSDFSDNQEL